MQGQKVMNRRAERPPERLLRIEEVMALCGLSRSGVYDAMREMNFPAPPQGGPAGSSMEALASSRLD